MKILAVIRRSPAKRFLVDVDNKKLEKELLKLISKNKHAQAMVFAFTKGKFEREVFEKELPGIKVDMILTEHNTSWDLTK